jgi:type II secretory pathway pseudopilin PulG
MLAGKAGPRKNEQGYAMAALIVAMSIMAIMMTVAMPVWKQAAQREKEEELVFRGKQYIHAIGLFQRKFANAFPPNLDVLVDQRFLRKKFKDPVTGEDFVPVLAAAQAAPGPAPSAGGPGVIQRATTVAQQPSQQQPQRGGGTGAATQPGGDLRGVSPIGTPGAGGGTTGGISGVTSKSKAQSIRLYNGRNHYNEWAFVYVPQVQAPAAGAPGTAVPGQIAQPPGQRGGVSGRGQRGSGPFDGAGRGRGGSGPFDNPGRGGRGSGPGQQPIMPPGQRGRL